MLRLCPVVHQLTRACAHSRCSRSARSLLGAAGMNRSFLLLSIVLVACGGASNDDEPSTTGTTSSATCAVAPGDDVCARTDVPAGDRPALQALSDYAGTAKTLLDGLHASCAAGLSDLSAAAASGTDPCDALALAIGTDGARISVRFEAPVCEEIAAPVCSPAGTKRTRCTGGGVVPVAPDDASPQETAVAEMIARRYGGVAAAKARLNQLADLAAEVATDLPAITSDCASSAKSMSATGTDATQEATRLADRMMAPLAR